MVINQGDVFWVDLGVPSGSAPGYRHPHVVVQNNLFKPAKPHFSDYRTGVSAYFSHTL